MMQCDTMLFALPRFAAPRFEDARIFVPSFGIPPPPPKPKLDDGAQLSLNVM